jgi:hypothetical protein
MTLYLSLEETLRLANIRDGHASSLGLLYNTGTTQTRRGHSQKFQVLSLKRWKFGIDER